jgi:hypothetical protein
MRVSNCPGIASSSLDRGRYHEGLVKSSADPYDGVIVIDTSPRLRTLCVARHRFLSDHLARFFTDLGAETRYATGLEDALSVSRDFDAEVIICEYELLTTLSLEAWERDELLSRRPVIAVSLTRRPHEAHLLDVNGIGGFLYLPLLDRDAALRLISAAAATAQHVYVPAPAVTFIRSELQAGV